jgi:hypothetical protein
MKLIESKTLGTAQASIEFTSIPATFTDLVVLVAGRSSNNNSPYYVADLFIGFNGTTTNLTGRYLWGSSSAAGSFSGTTFIGWVPSNDATSNTFGNVSIYIPNYAGSTNKSLSVDDVTETNHSNSDANRISLAATLWSQTAAITSFALTTQGNFVAGSTVSLYGVLKGSDGIVTTS